MIINEADKHIWCNNCRNAFRLPVWIAERRLSWIIKRFGTQKTCLSKLRPALNNKKNGCAYFYDEDVYKTVIKQEVITINDYCESSENRLNATIIISDEE